MKATASMFIDLKRLYVSRSQANSAPATPSEIAWALRKDSIVRLFEPGEKDWKYRFEKHKIR